MLNEDVVQASARTRIGWTPEATAAISTRRRGFAPAVRLPEPWLLSRVPCKDSFQASLNDSMGLYSLIIKKP